MTQEVRSCGRRLGRAALAAVLLSLVVGNAGTAAEPVVPGGIQATLAVRILEYDRALKGWAGSAVTVGIAARSTASAAEFRGALATREAQGVPIKTVEHVFKDPEGLKAWMDRAGVRLLYLAPDVGAEPGALAAGASRKLPTLVATRAQFQAGATLGLVVKDGKPHILVNLPSSKVAGMDLDPKLLQLSEVVR